MKEERLEKLVATLRDKQQTVTELSSQRSWIKTKISHAHSETVFFFLFFCVVLPISAHQVERSRRYDKGLVVPK